MREMTIEEIHSVELSLLDRLDAFCRRSGLTYYLAYGTLLGAVRHGGFIPWDDDADVCMPRDDYDRFLGEYAGESGCLLVRPFSEGYGFGWAKLVDRRTAYSNRRFVMPKEYGLSIDIFPLDVDGGERCYRIAHVLSQIRMVKQRTTINSSHDSLSKLVRRAMVKRLCPNAIAGQKAFDYLRASSSDSQAVINYFSRYSYERESMPKEWFAQGVDVPFEGSRIYRAPTHFERVLETVYGKEWRIPIVSTHKDVTVFWR